jgi:hypothetical protein
MFRLAHIESIHDVFGVLSLMENDSVGVTLNCDTEQVRSFS